MIAIRNEFGIVELLTIAEYIALEAAELERLIFNAAHDAAA
jgi:hypothetical protein